MPQGPPHIIFIISDDLGWHDCGWTNSGIATPALSKLRKEGTVLSNYYVQKVCTPSRAAFLTGRYPHRMGMQDPFWPSKAYGLDLNETTIADHLGANGYSCHAVGKWHVGFCDWRYTPTFRGFDSFYGFYGGGEDYISHTNGKSEHDPSPAFDFHWQSQPRCGPSCSQVPWNTSGKYSTHLFTHRAMDIIRNHDPKQPLFLYLAFQNVHSPAQVPPSYSAKYNATFNDAQRRTFAGMVTVMDEGVANITAALRAAGMWDRTLLVFTSDNGGPVRIGKHDSIGSSNWPLRGGKHSAYEGGVRGNAFLHGFGVPRGRTFGGLMHMVDWFATFSAAAGADKDQLSGLSLDSISLWGLWDQRKTPRHQVILDIQQDNVGAVRIGNFKLLVGQQKYGNWSAANGSLYAQRQDTYAGQALQLYNIATDPQEEVNIASEHPEVVQELLKVWDSENSGARFPESKGPDGDPVPVEGRKLRLWQPWL